jgi:hypothetical protein
MLWSWKCNIIQSSGIKIRIDLALLNPDSGGVAKELTKLSFLSLFNSAFEFHRFEPNVYHIYFFKVRKDSKFRERKKLIKPLVVLKRLDPDPHRNQSGSESLILRYIRTKETLWLSCHYTLREGRYCYCFSWWCFSQLCPAGSGRSSRLCSLLSRNDLDRQKGTIRFKLESKIQIKLERNPPHQIVRSGSSWKVTILSE